MLESVNAQASKKATKVTIQRRNYFEDEDDDNDDDLLWYDDDDDDDGYMCGPAIEKEGEVVGEDFSFRSYFPCQKMGFCTVHKNNSFRISISPTSSLSLFDFGLQSLFALR